MCINFNRNNIDRPVAGRNWEQVGQRFLVNNESIGYCSILMKLPFHCSHFSHHSLVMLLLVMHISNVIVLWLLICEMLQAVN